MLLILMEGANGLPFGLHASNRLNIYLFFQRAVNDVNNTGLRLKTSFKRSNVFQLILACFDALNPNILSILFGQVKFLRYV